MIKLPITQDASGYVFSGTTVIASWDVGHSERLHISRADFSEIVEAANNGREYAISEYDRGRRDGRSDVSEYSNAIGLIESALGIVGVVPLRETVKAVWALEDRTAQLEAHLVAVCNALEGVMHRHETERGREPLIAARAFLKQEKP